MTRRRRLSLFAITSAAGTAATGFCAARALWAAAPQGGAVAAPAVLPPTFKLSSAPPEGAVVLLPAKGDAASALKVNWYKRYTTDAPEWVVEKDGSVHPTKAAKYDLTSRSEFGDCYLHVEFKTPEGETGGIAAGGGNAGVSFLGRHEIQILNDWGKPGTESHGCAALYSQKAALVNACKKPGEWQTYDIVFRAPRFGADGKATEMPRATVFLNGVLVQNNEAFTGMTGIQYGQYKEMAATGPISLQGDHDPVTFRNLWVVPIPSAAP
jgi:hypothetical protein